MGYYRPWYRPYYWEKLREAEVRTPEAKTEVKAEKKVTYKRRYNKSHYKNVTLKLETYKLLKEACREKPFMDCVHEITLYYMNNMGVTPKVAPEVTKTEAEVRVTPEVTKEISKTEAEAPKVTPRELLKPILPRPWVTPRASITEAKIEKIKREIEELRERIEKIKQERLKKMAEAKPG